MSSDQKRRDSMAVWRRLIASGYIEIGSLISSLLASLPCLACQHDYLYLPAALSVQEAFVHNTSAHLSYNLMYRCMDGASSLKSLYQRERTWPFWFVLIGIYYTYEEFMRNSLFLLLYLQLYPSKYDSVILIVLEIQCKEESE